MLTLFRERYEVLATVGSGGEAQIVKALDRQHGRFVALKIRPVRDEAAREDLLGEARLLLSLPPHPALPLVREDFFDRDDYVVAMDWVDGTDLATLLDDRGRPGLATSSVLAWLAQAAEALTHLHSQSPPVIHGDVKPGNLILTKGGRIKLVDFGLSSAPYLPRVRAGTPGYRAPELAAGGTPSRASDVYALAATAFALLTGSAPAGVLPAWEGFDPAQARQLEAAIRLGVATDPGRRPKTPGELVERLRAGWSAALPTGVVTLCCSDIEGSSALWESDPEAMAAALVRHDELIADAVEARGGSLIRSMGEGDSTVSVFDSAPVAVEAALAANRALAAEEWPSGIRIAVRWGIHTGEAERRDADYYGPSVNLAARVRAQADGGEILLSSVTSELVGAHLPESCSLVDLGPHRLKGVGAPERIFAVAGPGVRTPPVTDCPYRGLLSYEAGDERFFFGREAVVADLVARVAGGELLAVVGASGSGKSSVLRAGLVAAARAGRIPGIDDAVVVTPGAGAVLGVPDRPETLLVVDQFEELFVLCDAAACRAAFVDALLARRGRVAIGLRADVYGRLGAHAGLAAAVAANQVLLGAMTDDELARAVAEPARLAGLRLEPGFVELILRDVAAEPGALPLLSHALRATWERRDGRTLTVEGYRASGGVTSAIARTADDVIDGLPADGRALARSVFLRMTELGEGTIDSRRRVASDELVPAGATSPDGVNALLERLAEARLVTLSDGSAEVAHEALIREWPRLRRWLEEDRAGIRAHRQLGDAARLWDAGGRETSDLYRGARLAGAIELAEGGRAELNATERAFLDASRAASDRAQRRLRLVLAVVAGLLIVAVIAGLVALNERGNARDEAIRAEAQRLGAQALTDSDLDRSLLLARQGMALDDSLQTRSNLLAALLKSPATTGVLRGDGDRLVNLDLSPDGRTVAFVDNDGTVTFVDTRTRQPAGRPVNVGGHLGTISDGLVRLEHVRFSPDGSLVAVGGGTPVVLDVRTHRVLARLRMGDDPLGRFIYELRFSGDGRTLFAGTALPPDRGIILQSFEPRTGRRLAQTRPVPGPFAWVALMVMRDQRHIVTAYSAGATTIRDARTLQPVRRLPVAAAQAALSPDDRTMLVGGLDGTVRFLDLVTGKVRVASGRHERAVERAVFSRDGRWAITAGEDGHVIVWDVAKAAAGETLEGHAGRVTGLAISNDSSTLYSSGLDGKVLIFDLAGTRRLGRPFRVGPENPGELPRFALSPDGRTLAVGRSDGTVALIDAETLTPRSVFRVPAEGPVDGMGYVPGGRLLAVGGDDGFLALVDPRRAEIVKRLYGHRAHARTGNAHGVFTPSFSANGRLMATAADDSTVRLWSLPSGKAVGRPLRFQALRGASLSPDGRTLAVIVPEFTRNPGVQIVDVATGRLRTTLSGAETIWDVARFTPDGRFLVGGSVKGWVRLWSTKTWKPATRALAGHTGAVIGQTTSADGRMLASGSADGTVRLWDLRRQQPLGAALPGLPNRGVVPQFTRDGAYLFAIYDSGRAYRWDVRASSWARHACEVAGRSLTRAEWQDALPNRDYAPACAG